MMKQVTVHLRLNADFYQEYASQMTETQLLKELRGEIADKVAELKLPQLLNVLKKTKTKDAIYKVGVF